MIVDLGTEICEAIVAVFVALGSRWPWRAGAGITTDGINPRACRTLSQVSVERFFEMLRSWTLGTVRCTLPWDIFVLCQVDVGGPWGFWTLAGASFGTRMGPHVVRAGMMVPKKTSNWWGSLSWTFCPYRRHLCVGLAVESQKVISRFRVYRMDGL